MSNSGYELWNNTTLIRANGKQTRTEGRQINYTLNVARMTAQYIGLHLNVRE